jgi:hypothetical protein
MGGSFLPARDKDKMGAKGKGISQSKMPKPMPEEVSRALVEAASQGRLIAITASSDSESDSESDKAGQKQGGKKKKSGGDGSNGRNSTGMGGVGVKALNAVAWATALQSSRDLMQTATLTSVFVATGGNLAASFAGEMTWVSVGGRWFACLYWHDVLLHDILYIGGYGPAEWCLPGGAAKLC